MSSQRTIKIQDFDAAIFDLDGVITQTAAIHARAWKAMFDEFLQWRSKNSFESFVIERDYTRYIDGKPRYDGVRSFLQARGIALPEGDPSDSPDDETVCGLGNRKNELFHELIENEGVDVFEDTLALIEHYRQLGLKLAVVSSSRNCEAILRVAGLNRLFDVRVDGVTARERGLPGKPAPDLFLEAARDLGVEPQRAIVFEDAISGVQAGRAGQFGLVVGVARHGNAETLLENGADIAVEYVLDLQKWEQPPDASAIPAPPPPAMERPEEIARQLVGKHPVIFLDYDGTLTPIVPRPEDAVLSEEMRSVLRKLARYCTVAIVSGRDRADVKNLVGIEELLYAGSHGFDISGPAGLVMQQPQGIACLPDLDMAEGQLHRELDAVPGLQVERKRFAIAVHYRNVEERYVSHIENVVERVQVAQPHLRKRGGKKIFELQPDIEWDKGHAVLWLLAALQLNHPDNIPIYLGDDLTDEDAFRALSGRGLGIFVGEPAERTAADYRLANPNEVQQFLSNLVDRLATGDRSQWQPVNEHYD